jgi:hypothetical protein
LTTSRPRNLSSNLAYNTMTREIVPVHDRDPRSNHPLERFGILSMACIKYNDVDRQTDFTRGHSRKYGIHLPWVVRQTIDCTYDLFHLRRGVRSYYTKERYPEVQTCLSILPSTHYSRAKAIGLSQSSPFKTKTPIIESRLRASNR